LSKILIFLFSLILLIIIIEVIVNIFFNKLIKNNEFNFRKVLKKSESLGWLQKKNLSFFYYHRYLNRAKKIFLKTNNFGIIDKEKYLFNNNKIKVAIFGDNSISGFDTSIEDGFNSLLRKKIKNFNKDINVYNFTNRDYCTLQYFNFYKKYLSHIKFDLIIYVYSHNHSRRNVTIHESAKSKIFTQPVYDFKLNKKISLNQKFIKNDNIFLDRNNCISIVRAKKKPLKIFFYERLFTFSIIYDVILGQAGLKKMDHIHSLKNIEKTKSEFHWNYTHRILSKWLFLLKKNKTKFVITNAPSFYHNPNFNHKYGVKVNEIKERNKISFFCKTNKIIFFDNYKLNIKKFYKQNFFIHSRYAYLNKRGYNYFTDKILMIIKKTL